MARRHTELQKKVAGRKGRTEVEVGGGKQRLDVKRGNTATEIERSGRIREAIKRLATQKTAKKELLVRQGELDTAKEIALQEGVKVTIQNLERTRRRFAKPKQ